MMMKRKHEAAAWTTVDGRSRPDAEALEDDRAHKLSVNVSYDVGQRLKRLAFEQRLSESSIVEVALTALFSRGDDEHLGTFLRARGASLRRKLKLRRR